MDVQSGSGHYCNGDSNGIEEFYLYSRHLRVGFYIDNYANNFVTNKKFVIAMLIGGRILLYWGKFRNGV